ncbi:alpha/beta hydrolase [Bifidobacterium dolichotidis]|uniref:Alpha/beta hydrolase n=1 Tax=Bifidobacterium dolichotidis TaxID=2306976 RepID=A0A430FTI7_9BIFI|nr:alpha/beta fold hydrolase [Bifidobacterium dolichotidis]RSX56202.1 alpha/beta hydrolase [Bifidobacterium dolichotidis]
MSDQQSRVEQLEIDRDGLKLHTVITRPATNGAQDVRYPAVIILHGLFGDMGYLPEDLLPEISDKLVAQGFMTVRFDFAGRGESTGIRNGFDAFSEIEDTIAVLEHVRQLEDVESISLVGHSFGGAIASMVAGMYNDVIHTLALLAPAATMKDDAMHGKVLDGEFDAVHVPDEIEVPSKKASVTGRFARIVRTLPIYEIAGQFNKPTLFIQGRDDQVLKSTSAANNYEEAMSHCQVSLYDDLGHLFRGAQREVAVNEVVEFLTLNK